MISSAVFLAVFAVYLSALYPHIAPEDSGEFAAAAWTLGVPHPSGYSLYVLLGKAAVVLIPFGNPAYRVNLLSAALGAGSVLLLAAALKRFLPDASASAQIIEQIERQRWRGASVWLAAALWAVVPGVWYLSVLAEVYALELFLGALLLWSAARWLDAESFFSRNGFLSRWSLSAFILGLGAAVHHTLVLWTPALAGLVFVRQKSFGFAKPLSAARTAGEPGRWTFRGHGRTYAGLAALFLALGFSIQLFLYFRAQADPVLNTGDPGAWDRFLRVVLRQDYGTFSLAKTGAETSRLAALGTYLLHTWEAFTPVGLALLAWGAYRLARSAFPLVAAFLALWVFAGPVFILLANPPIQDHFQGVMERFYPLSFIGLLPYLAWGLYEAGTRWRRLRAAVFLLIPLSLSAHAFVSGRGNLHARDFGLNLLNSLPPGSVLWDPGDSAAYSVLYQHLVPGRRTDVAAVTYHRTLWGQERVRDRFPDLFAGEAPEGFDPDFLRRLLAGPRGEWVFSETPRGLPGNDPADRVPAPDYPRDAIPFGAAYRYFPASTHRLVDPAAQLSLARLTFWWYRRSSDWSALPPPRPTLFGFRSARRTDPFTVEILRRYAEARTNLGQKFAQHRILDSAEGEYYIALTIDPFQMEAYNNLGVLAYENRDGFRAAAFFKRAAERAPGNPGLLANLGQSYLLAEQYDSALEAFDRALSLDPNLVRARFLTADILEKQKRFEQALAHWRALRNAVPDDREVHWRLARNYAALGRPDAANEALREYLLFDLTDEERSEAERFQAHLSALSRRSL